MITALIPNRNLLTTLKGTVDFLLKDPRIEVIIYDQDSSYEPLLEYYKSLPERVGVIYTKANGGPHSVWDPFLAHYREDYYIVADPDCSYEGVPEDWLDKMINTLENLAIPKVGFSLRTDDLPDNGFSDEVRKWEQHLMRDVNEYGCIAHIDTTFALYRPYSAFTLDAIRLKEPYCIRHTPWYLTVDNLNAEWRNYLEQSSTISFWGTRLKNSII